MQTYSNFFLKTVPLQDLIKNLLKIGYIIGIKVKQPAIDI